MLGEFSAEPSYTALFANDQSIAASDGETAANALGSRTALFGLVALEKHDDQIFAAPLDLSFGGLY
jgi:hypothetical protein